MDFSKTKKIAIQTETDLLNSIRLKYSAMGARLWRNNVGAYYDTKRQLIRYGLANESKKINESLKSADLIGILPITITAEHIGKTIGQFVSLEIKKPRTSIKNNKRFNAQKNWMNLINKLGGYAEIINHDD